MFTNEDRISLLAELREKEASTHQALILVLDHLVQNKHPDIDTIKDLREFTYAFPTEDIELLVKYYLGKKAIGDRFSSIAVFREFLIPSSPLLSKMNLLFLTTWLIPKTHQIIQEKNDAISYLYLLCTTLNTEELLAFFYTLHEEQVLSLFKPFQLPYSQVLMQSEEEGIVRQYDTVRAAIPAIYDPGNTPLYELIGDLFYHWTQLGYGEAINMSMQQHLFHIARYVRFQEQQIRRYNTFKHYEYALFKHHRALLVDVDYTLIKRPDGPANYYQRLLIFNLQLIDELKKIGIPVFLFTDISCHFKNVWERLKIKKYLEAQGIPVIRILTPSDLLADLSPESLKHLQELSAANDEQTFIADFLVQAILTRLTQNELPPTLGKTFDDATVFFNRKIAERCANGQLSDDEQEEYRQIEEITCHRDVITHDNRRTQVYDTIRKIDALESSLAERRFTHIKWQMLKQFILYQHRVSHIDIYDDQAPLLNYIDQSKEGCFTAERCTITTHQITFPESPYPPSSYYRHFFGSKKTSNPSVTKATSPTENKCGKGVNLFPSITEEKKEDALPIINEQKDAGGSTLPKIGGLRIGTL